MPTIEATPGREIIQIVEIQQPFCANTFGISPCTATGTNDQKCYNTFGTCLDKPNFSLSSLSLFFSRGDVASRGVPGISYLIPSLVSVSTAPTALNLSSSSSDSQGLGNRAVCNIVFADHAHTDRVVDPYVSGRSWNPLQRGSFWTKWLARNRYRNGAKIVVYEGYYGQALVDMTKRTYFLTAVDGPGSGGQVTIQGKDILAKLEERKAQAPIASPGELFKDINSTSTSIEVTGAVEADYSPSGTIRINNEIMTYSALAASANGITFTISARGSDNTSAASHSAGDSVQECLRFQNARPDDAVYDLLTNYGGIDASYTDVVAWASEVDTYMSLTRLNGLITEPVSVYTLVSEIQEQTQCMIWWDERAAKIRFKAVRGIDAVPPLITEQYHVIADSLSITEEPRNRVSQVWVYYNQQDKTAKNDDVKSYANLLVLADLASESQEQHGEPSIRKIFARLINSSAVANTIASKILTRYVNNPRRAIFRLDAKDRSLWVGDVIQLSHRLDVDQNGNLALNNWTIISAEEIVPGEVVEYIAEDTTLSGRIHYIMADGTPDFPGYDSAPFKNAYIGDSSGLLSDGSSSARIN